MRITTRTSVVMTATVADDLRRHVDRPDGQEDICVFTYRLSTGRTRRTAIVTSVLSPERGERHVHGNASIEGEYVLRAISYAHERGDGIGICHSHPGATGWQNMSGPDRDAEAGFANLTREITGFPLIGMTFAGKDHTWSARHWDLGDGADVEATHCDSVRVVGDVLAISWNDANVPPPFSNSAQVRSVSCWGPKVHASVVRRRVLVVGVGSVGLDVATRLAATGMTDVGVMDFDAVEVKNLDRLIGADRLDARLLRAKIAVARREMLSSATADSPRFDFFELSICEPEGLAVALDYDLVISCVDRPWPRAVLNQLAFADLIPVIDGGIAIDAFADGSGMRNATWRSHVIRPGRPCLVCNSQLDVSEVNLEVEGLLDDPTYVEGAEISSETGQNVAMLSISVAASLLAQFVSLNVGPGGIGDPGPVQYLLSTHTLEHLDCECRPGCAYESATATGDRRIDMTGRHVDAENQRESRQVATTLRLRLLRSLDSTLLSLRGWINRQL